MTIGNDLHLKHSVGLVMRELHAFAAATGAPAGEDVFRWAESKWNEVSEALAAARRVARPAPQQPTYGRLTVPAGLNRPHNGDCLPACYHEPYQGSCVHCGVPFRNGRPTPATPEGNVGAIVPPHCTGSSLSFEPGVLHVRKDGSGYIAIDEKHFALEDDRCDGPDGPEGSVHWITRLDASEMVALRDFLNGQRATPEGLREESTVAEQAIRHLSRLVRVYGDMQDGNGNTPTEIRHAERFLSALQPQAQGGE